MKTVKKRMVGGCVFLGALLVAFVTLDLLGEYRPANLLKFVGICGCLLLAFCYRTKGLDSILLRLALGLTVCADVLLLFTGAYAVGIGLFCGVQLLYTFRYTRRGGATALVFLLGCAVFWMLRLAGLPALYALAAGYGTLLLSVTAIVLRANWRENPFVLCPGRLSCAMVLFVLCDLSVAAYQLGVDWAGVLIWMFYLPSQALIALSGAMAPAPGEIGN